MTTTDRSTSVVGVEVPEALLDATLAAIKKEVEAGAAQGEMMMSWRLLFGWV